MTKLSLIPVKKSKAPPPLIPGLGGAWIIKKFWYYGVSTTISLYLLSCQRIITRKNHGRQ